MPSQHNRDIIMVWSGVVLIRSMHARRGIVSRTTKYLLVFGSIFSRTDGRTYMNRVCKNPGNTAGGAAPPQWAEICRKADERKLRVRPLLEADDTEGFEMSQNDLSTSLTFVKILDNHKALLIGSKDDTDRMGIEDFGLFVDTLGFTKYPYIGGAAPRTNIECLGENPLSTHMIFVNASLLLYYIIASRNS